MVVIYTQIGLSSKYSFNDNCTIPYFINFSQKQGHFRHSWSYLFNSKKKLLQMHAYACTNSSRVWTKETHIEIIIICLQSRRQTMCIFSEVKIIISLLELIRRENASSHVFYFIVIVNIRELYYFFHSLSFHHAFEHYPLQYSGFNEF